MIKESLAVTEDIRVACLNTCLKVPAALDFDYWI
jgi:hypothetical protein